MTKKELLIKMNQFIQTQSAVDKDDWYVSSREASQIILCDFAEFLNINGVKEFLAPEN